MEPDKDGHSVIKVYSTKQLEICFSAVRFVNYMHLYTKNKLFTLFFF